MRWATPFRRNLFQRWDSGRCAMSSPVRDGRNPLRHPMRSFAPGGAWECFDATYPAMNRWAIFGCPCGTYAIVNLNPAVSCQAILKSPAI